MKIVIFFVLFAIALSSCTISYKAGEIKQKVNYGLPQNIDLKVAKLNVNSLSKVRMHDNEQRIYFEFDCKVSTIFKTFECRTFKLSAKPILENGKIIMTDFKADDINCGGIPLTDLINWVKNYFLKEIDVVQLTGMKRRMVKKVYIEGESVMVRWGIF